MLLRWYPFLIHYSLASTKTCYHCESACSENAGINICLKQAENSKSQLSKISLPCQKKLACCYGNKFVNINILDQQPCLGVCQTKFIDQPSSESLTVVRRCESTNKEKYGIFYGNGKLKKSDKKFPRLPVFSCEKFEEGCISLCNCKGNLCNSASEIGNCVTDWSFTASFLWYLMWLLIVFILIGEFMWHFGLNCKILWIHSLRPFCDRYFLRRVYKNEPRQEVIDENETIFQRTRSPMSSAFDTDV